MSRSKNDKELERLEKRCKQMERCGQYHTVHHENLERYKQSLKKPKSSIEEKGE